MDTTSKRRICRTPEDSYRAGREDGAATPYIFTAAQRERLIVLLRPYLGASDRVERSA